MHPLSSSTDARRAARAGYLATALTAAALVAGTTQAVAASCPWIVQPADAGLAPTADAPAFDIVFEGLDRNTKVFYGFTVASLDLAWALTNQATLPELDDDGRKLSPKITPHGTRAFQLDPDTIEPQTIYLVAASGVVAELEQLGARIDPSRPMAVSQLMARTRGGSDWSGALPHRSLPGFEIASADDPSPSPTRIGGDVAALQICAYQVATR
jgi:hypothetical protein